MEGVLSSIPFSIAPGPTPGVRNFNLLQVHHYGLPYAQESNLEQAADLAIRYGFTGLLCKALDGTTWMGTIPVQSRAPDAIRSVRQVQQHHEYCHSRGLEYYIWTNPLTTNSIVTQAELSGDLANACDGLFLDVEPYNEFWGRNNPVGMARDFCQRIRQKAPDAFICLQPDPRPTQFPGIRPEEWLDYVDAVSGQHYWPLFGTTAQAELAAAQRFAELCGKPNYPTLYYNINPHEPIEGEFPGFVLFVMGYANSNVLEAVGGIKVK